MLEWLLDTAIVPAAVAVPVSWTADALAGAARRWFRRFRRADDLSRLVKAATGGAVELTRTEFDCLRRLLEDHDTWDVAARGTVEDLTGRMLSCLPHGSGRTPDQARAAAETIARGLLEFVISDLEPGLFQQVLLTRMQRIEANQASELDEAMLSLHADLCANFADLTQHLMRLLERMPPGPANRGEIAVYLWTLKHRLNVDPWPLDRQYGRHAPAPADIECQLRVRVTVGTDTEEWDADTLAEHCQRLVILGDPGYGKTWLAKHTARRCADSALKALREGCSLDEILLPLYTTCASLSAAWGGNIRDAVVSSALGQIGDLGGSRLWKAIHVFFTERNAPTLLIADSLDEAPGSDLPIRQVDTLPWRIILTSRPSAWNRQLTIKEPNQSAKGAVELHRIGELRRLRYPDDIHYFIERWFSSDPERGRDLARQISQRPSLQEAVTVPLILAFYCIIGGQEHLPDFRRDLYNKVLRRILAGRWRDTNSSIDVDACFKTLREWAWEGAATNHFSGIATWAEEVPTTHASLSDDEVIAVSHVATPLYPRPDDDSGKTLRRFIHRSIREHFVAGHIAGLPVEQAVEQLLPHMWYDTDWEYVAPAALAMHPNRDQLLRTLIRRAARVNQIPDDLSVIDIGGQWHEFLGRVAAESSGSDWSSEMAQILRSALKHSDPIRGDYVERLVWGKSNNQARQTLLKLLAEDPFWMTDEILAEINRFAPTAQDKRDVRKALLELIVAETRPKLAIKLVSALVRLDVTAQDERRALEALLALLESESEVEAAGELVRQLIGLAPRPEDKRRARQALHRILRAQTGDWPSVARLLGGTVELDPTIEDKRRLREKLLWLLSGETDPNTATQLATGVVDLAPSTLDKEQARTSLVMALADAYPQATSALVGGVVLLDPTAADERQMRDALFNRLLHESDPRSVVDLAGGLVRLPLTPEDRREVREVLLGALDGEGEWGDIVDHLIELDVAAQDRQETRQALLLMLNGTWRWSNTDSVHLVDELIQRNLTAEDRHETRETLLRILDRNNAWHAGPYLTERLIQCDVTAEDRRETREILFRMLDESNGWLSDVLANSMIQHASLPEEQSELRNALLMRLIEHPDQVMANTLLDMIIQLEPTGTDVDRLRVALLRALDQLDSDTAIGLARIAPTDATKRDVCISLVEAIARTNNRWNIEKLMNEVIRLASATDDKRHVRQALLGLLPSSAPGKVAWALAQLEPTDEDKLQAHTALLSQLMRQTDVWAAEELVDGLTQLDPTVEDKRQARTVLIRFLGAVDPAGEMAFLLMDKIAQLSPNVNDLNTWPTALILPSPEVLASMRRNSSLDDWLATLPILKSLGDQQLA